MLDKKIGVSVVIPTLNGLGHLKDFLKKNLEIVKAARESDESYKWIEVVVVDDNSNDTTIPYLESVKREFDFLHFAKNPKQGISSARNFGVSISSLGRLDEEACHQYILFIDNDVLLESDFFAKASKYLRAGLFSITCNGINYYTRDAQDGVKLIEYSRGFLRFSRNVFERDLEGIKEEAIPSFGAQGAYFFTKYEDFIELGGFDEAFDPYVLEESDLVYRGLKRGKECIFASDVIAYHKVGGTIRSRTSRKTKLMSKRNRIYFVWKNVHNKSLLFQHLFFLAFSALSPLGFKALVDAIPMLKKARAFNKEERGLIIRDDLSLLRESKRFKEKAQG